MSTTLKEAAVVVSPELQDSKSQLPELNQSKGSLKLKSDPWRLFLGDIVVYRTKYPQEDLFPSYGIIVDGHGPLVRHSRAAKNADPNNLEGKYFVHWERSQQIQHVARDEVHLIDRPLQRGQLIRSAEGSRGTVVDVERLLSLQILSTNYIVENVPATKLIPISPFVRGQEILYKGWVGVITAVKRRLHFALDSGGQMYYATEENDGFMNMDPYWGIGAQCPGSKVRLAPRILRQVRFYGNPIKEFFWNWPLVNQFYALKTAEVLMPRTMGVKVKWLCKNPFEESELEEPPLEFVDQALFGKAVPIGKPASETMQSNSIRIYDVEPSDILVDNRDWYRTFHFKHIVRENDKAVPPTKPVRKVHPRKNSIDAQVSVILRQTQVTVEWENGIQEKMMSTDIPYIYPFEEDSPCRAGLVVANALEESPNTYGIIFPREADYKMVMVRWVKFTEGPQENEETVYDLGIKEESVYDLKPHPEYCLFQRGTVVFHKPGLEGLPGGSVVDLDLQSGKMLVANPLFQEPLSYWPHQVKALSKRCYWNFFTKKWVVNDYIPPTYVMELPTYIRGNESAPESIKLTASNNNILDKIDSSLKDEPPFEILDEAPKSHAYYDFEPPKLKFLRNYAHEEKTLKDRTPNGVWIRAYQDRMDLLSVLFLGPENTPYEDGIFMFDLQLTREFPEVPPKIKYISFSTGAISPLIDQYTGDFCMSSLKWDTSRRLSSAILMTVQRIQMIFRSEPYIQAYDISKDNMTPQNVERSRAYNERVMINVLQSSYNMAFKPHEPWRRHISQQLSLMLPHKIAFLKKILEQDTEIFDNRAYPLFPVSRAYEISLQRRVQKLIDLFPKEKLESFLATSTKETTVEKTDEPTSAISVPPLKSDIKIEAKDSENNVQIKAEVNEMENSTKQKSVHTKRKGTSKGIKSAKKQAVDGPLTAPAGEPSNAN